MDRRIHTGDKPLAQLLARNELGETRTRYHFSGVPILLGTTSWIWSYFRKDARFASTFAKLQYYTVGPNEMPVTTQVTN